MNKVELIEAVSVKVEITKKDASKIVEAVFNIITEELQTGNPVKIVGFGSFETRKRAERSGRNPQTGDEITIAASTVPVWKASGTLKDKFK